MNCIEELIKEIEKLKEGVKLLEEVHTMNGPYSFPKVKYLKHNASKLEQEENRKAQLLLSKINDYFDFDDSE